MNLISPLFGVVGAERSCDGGLDRVGGPGRARAVGLLAQHRGEPGIEVVAMVMSTAIARIGRGVQRRRRGGARASR